MKWMRSIVAMRMGGRPFLLAGAKGMNKPVNSIQSTKRFIMKIKLAVSLSDQFKYGEGEGGLFHQDITLESVVTMTLTSIHYIIV